MSAHHKPYTRFVIISSHRSGSNYLSSLLSSHPNIMSIGEVYNPSVLFADPGQPKLHENRLAKLVRDMAPVWFVKHGIYRTYPSRIQAVGFRYFYLHAQGKFKPVLDYLREEKSIRVIHLKRKNLLRSYWSLLAAQQTGVWTVPSLSARTQPPVRLDLEPDACTAYFTTMERYMSVFDTHFADHDVLEVTYEGLVSRLDREQERLAAFLGIPTRSLSASTKKLNDKPLRSLISNFPALERHFRTTKWHQFFHDERG